MVSLVVSHHAVYVGDAHGAHGPHHSVPAGGMAWWHGNSIHVNSVNETRQSKATTPKDKSFFFKRKGRAASGGIRTHNILHTRQTLYQLSHRGSSAGQAESLQGKGRLSPDGQGNSISVVSTLTVNTVCYGRKEAEGYAFFKYSNHLL